MRTCAVCGKEFFHSKLRKKTCSPSCARKLCYPKTKKEYMRQRYLEHKHILKKIRKKKYRKNKLVFKERNHQAYLKRKARLQAERDKK